MTTLKNLLDLVTWEQVEDTMTVRGIQPRRRPYFRNVLKSLRFLEPMPSKMKLVVLYIECEDGDYVHVSGVVDNDEEHYALYFTRWEQCLGMEVVESCLLEFEPAEIVAASMRVMSFDGPTQGRIRARAESIFKSRHRAHRIFLSYSTDDKSAVARPLALALEALGLTVWYDEYELLPGDSLRKSISAGITKAPCAVVILSQSYFRKAWTARELSGIVSMETSRRIPIIPIWHNVTLKEVVSYDPSLADRIALSTSELSIDEIATRINEAVLTRVARR